MLISPKILLDQAQKEKYAIGAFNTCNLEITKAIFSAANSLNSPIIVQTSEGEARHGEVEKLAHLIADFIRETKVQVALNLDHGNDFELIKRAIACGYTSVMIDGSKLPYEENIVLTTKVVQYAHKYSIPVEGELGLVKTPKQQEIINENDREKSMTDPDLALDFIKKTGIDFLAVGIGNLHGFYKGKPELDFKRLSDIKKRVKIPLVLHGGSGISNQDIQKAISLGICKININTELRLAFANNLRKVLSNKEMNAPYEIMKPVELEIQKVVEERIGVFGSANKI